MPQITKILADRSRKSTRIRLARVIRVPFRKVRTMKPLFRYIQHHLTMLSGILLLAALTAGFTAVPGLPASPTPTVALPTSTPTPEPPNAGDVQFWFQSADRSSCVPPSPDVP